MGLKTITPMENPHKPCIQVFKCVCVCVCVGFIPYSKTVKPEITYIVCTSRRSPQGKWIYKHNK